jgi:DNA-binding NtrC family response regulator
VIFCEGKQITLSDLPKQYSEAALERNLTGMVLEEATDNLTRELIQDALDRSGGQKQLAAEILNIHRKTLYNKMKKLGMN